MNNIVGQTPRGDDFFPRPDIIEKIYRKLDAGENIYMVAPRRAGKTAIMRHLGDNPRSGVEFQYLITESVDNATTYFKLLLDSFKKFNKISKGTLKAIGDFLDKIDKVELFSLKVELNQKEAQGDNGYFEEFKQLIKELATEDETKIVVMIDEFPQTVENILRKHGNGAAEQFLQFNRELRHQDNQRLKFILTGPIGLTSVAEKLDATKEINDLNIIEISPLNPEQARDFTKKLLDYANIVYSEDALDYMLNKIDWFIPFHIQLVVQELIEECETAAKPVNKTAVDRAFANISKRRNDIYFQHYYSRLKKTFAENECHFAFAVLKELANNDACTVNQLENITKQHKIDNYPMVLRVLESDGYLFKSGGSYRFTSPVLRQWWRDYAV